jgi:L-2,4-diaminobutyrate transaminase
LKSDDTVNAKLSDLQICDRDAHLHPFTSVHDLLAAGPTLIKRGSGCILEDADGNRLYDAAAGLWCVNIGHGRREVIQAITEQLEQLAFFHTFNGMGNEPAAKLARRILAVAPANMRRVFFGNSGSDANDSAVKLIWYYNNLRGRPKKKTIIARDRAYHGVTVMAASLTGLPGVHRMFDLPLSSVRHVSCPDTYRFPERDAGFYADELENLILVEGADTIAAFFAEPVMGTGGVLIPPRDYFDAISAVLRKHDVLLVSDEVITGFGRIGAWFGLEKFGFLPDLITSAKGLTSNYIPMSALIIGDKIWSELESKQNTVGVWGHGFTTSSHPVAAAAGLATLKIIEEENLLSRARIMGAKLTDALRNAISGHRLVGDVRGCGLMVGIELVADRASKQSFDPAIGVARTVQHASLAAGVLVRALPLNDVIALSPPLTVDEATIGEIVKRLAVGLDTASGAV